MKRHHAIIAALLWTVASLHAQTPPPNPSLTPPGAPMDGVFKTLDQVEARIPVNAVNTPGTGSVEFVIGNPGSYYLTSDIVLTTDKEGIRIEDAGVQLDLNGFSIVAPAAGSTSEGILIHASVGNTEGVPSIRNGTIRGFGRGGVRETAGKGVQLEDLVVEQCGSNAWSGIAVHGGATTIRGCKLIANKGKGITIFGVGVEEVLIESCVFSLNKGDGAFVEAGIVRGCTSVGNEGDGIRASSSIISNCLSSENQGNGILVRWNSHVSGNLCRSNGAGAGNTGAAISVTGNNNRVEGNSLISSDTGLNVTGSGNFVVRNTMSGNTIDFDISAGNQVGKIYAAPSGGAISGSGTPAGVGAGVGTTDPWANFTY